MTTNQTAPCEGEALKPCPFCGDAGVHVEPVPLLDGIWGVHCPNGLCPTSGNYPVTDFSEDEAAEQWNKRSGDRPDLHPVTADLVDRFAVALKAKLAAAEKKYDMDPLSWMDEGWQAFLVSDLQRHVQKGEWRPFPFATVGVPHPALVSRDGVVAEIEASPDLIAAAEEFCRRVEAGEIRSKKSYAAFKEALAALSIVGGGGALAPLVPAGGKPETEGPPL